tara:strand:- start:201 stop:710 length:510 start_codon:yes stop_codon:yes gene_type:complete
MITNNSGIKRINIKFDLNPLIDKLEKSPDDFLLQEDLAPHLFRAVAVAAKKKIKSGKAGRALKPSTIEIRKKRNQPAGPPLLASGTLLNSIKGTKKGLFAVDYAELHLGKKEQPHAYTVKAGSSKFTRFWKRDHKVPKRNFLPIRGELDITNKAKRILVRQINNLIKRR